MRVLVGCEESQTVCRAFRRRGHEAYSCDLLPTRGNPDWHIQEDVVKVVGCGGWDLIILHPDCTAMAVSGNRWYGRGRPRHEDRIRAVAWTEGLWSLAISRCKGVVLENPVSVIFTLLKRQFEIQYIQPWQFGHGEVKKTGLALHGLPPLRPTNVVEGREARIWRMPPSPSRKRDRSVTYQGIADAMAEQWGGDA